MHRPGIAMVEAVLATAIVGGLAVAAMSLVGSVAAERRVSVERSMGQLLVRQLAEEIAALPTDDSLLAASEPVGTSGSGSGSSGGGSLLDGLVNGILSGGSQTAQTLDSGDGSTVLSERELFLDVLAYDNYTESPPADRGGSEISGAGAWTRSVEVTEVTPSDLQGEAVAGTGVYRVRVTALVNGRLAGETAFYRSVAGDEAMR